MSIDAGYSDSFGTESAPVGSPSASSHATPAVDRARSTEATAKPAAPVDKTVEEDDAPTPKKRPRRRSTSHLKDVPDTLELRERIKGAAEQFAKTIDHSKPFSKNDLEAWGKQLLLDMNQPEQFLGFAMVLIGNFFWKRQFMAIPFERRMLLLPHCLKHAEGCPADYDEFGLDCEKCGACSIADYKVRAEQLGYKVLVAEGSPIVLKIIVSGHIDGILGVACLNVLEKAIDKVLIAGVPSYAIPLHSGDCKNTKLDESWVWDVLEKYEPIDSQETTSYVPLMRAANRLFDDADKFEEHLPRIRTKKPEQARSPLGFTERVAYDWLANGGKRFRPFMTLAAYDAVTGGEALSLSPETPPAYATGVGRVAMAIEAFHKASLVHDDIEDDDQYRYGRETLHRKHGLGPAINVGDHLIGLGYRLVSSARPDIGAEAAAEILEKMAAAHIKLCDGQGAEMAWQDDPDLGIAPIDALQIYALKTSPAFEAALYAGLRMAGCADEYEEPVSQFARQIGVGFQILNDLKDWRGDGHNKLLAGQDALALRPTVLLALAMQAAEDSERHEIRDLFESDANDERKVIALRQFFERHNVFEKADALVEKSRARAESIADEIQPEPLRQLLYFLCDTVLAAEEPDAPNLPTPTLVPLSIVAP